MLCKRSRYCQNSGLRRGSHRGPATFQCALAFIFLLGTAGSDAVETGAKALATEPDGAEAAANAYAAGPGGEETGPNSHFTGPDRAQIATKAAKAEGARQLQGHAQISVLSDGKTKLLPTTLSGHRHVLKQNKGAKEGSTIGTKETRKSEYRVAVDARGEVATDETVTYFQGEVDEGAMGEPASVGGSQGEVATGELVTEGAPQSEVAMGMPVIVGSSGPVVAMVSRHVQPSSPPGTDLARRSAPGNSVASLWRRMVDASMVQFRDTELGKDPWWTTDNKSVEVALKYSALAGAILGCLVVCCGARHILMEAKKARMEKERQQAATRSLFQSKEFSSSKDAAYLLLAASPEGRARATLSDGAAPVASSSSEVLA